MKSVRNYFLLAAMLCGTWSFDVPVQASEYRIAPGETLEISIASIPNHLQRSMVQADGTIVLPEAGSISVAGLTPAELQARLELVLPTKLFHIRAPDGKRQSIIVEPSDISSSVVAYRPVYVTGDVLTPGEQTYHPMMTTRQAVAVAGGYSFVRSQVVMPKAGDPVDLQRDYESLWAGFIKAYYHQERLKAELKGSSDFEQDAPAGSPLQARVTAAIAKSEADSLALTLEDQAKERLYLESAIIAATEQIGTLAKREKVEAAAEKADEQDMEKVSQLFKAGDTSNARMAELRRAVMLSSSRRLSTLVELMRMRRQLAEFERQLVKNEDHRKVALFDNLRDGGVQLAELGSQLRAAGTKLQSVGINTQIAPDAAEPLTPHVTIVRWVDNAWQNLVSTDNFEVLPGDVVEVKLCSDEAACGRKVVGALD
jgi:polysaccharide biosynthesis/export protein